MTSAIGSESVTASSLVNVTQSATSASESVTYLMSTICND
jgi:hypothetical protein